MTTAYNTAPPATTSTCSRPLHAKILATASALPDQVISNQQIIERYHHKVADRAIRKMTGVVERRVVPRGVADTDLMVTAAKSCLQRAGIAVDSLGKLIVTRFLGDRMLPMTAANLQKKLDCTVAIQSFDISGGVHSFMEALHTAACAVESDGLPVLVVSGGIVNRLVSRTDPAKAFLFGDGAGAVLLGPAEVPRFLASSSFCNIAFLENATAFRLKEHVTEEMYEKNRYDPLFDLYEQKNWKPATTYILDAMHRSVAALLSDAGIGAEEVDLWLITENEQRLWRAIVDTLDIPYDKTHSLLSTLGNTMSAMLPILLNDAMEKGMAQKGSKVVLLSLGEGIKGGGMLITL